MNVWQFLRELKVLQKITDEDSTAKLVLKMRKSKLWNSN